MNYESKIKTKKMEEQIESGIEQLRIMNYELKIKKMEEQADRIIKNYKLRIKEKK
jgi:hypothetical protein